MMFSIWEQNGKVNSTCWTFSSTSFYETREVHIKKVRDYYYIFPVQCKEDSMNQQLFE